MKPNIVLKVMAGKVVNVVELLRNSKNYRWCKSKWEINQTFDTCHVFEGGYVTS